MADQLYIIFMKDKYGIITWGRGDPNVSAPGCEVLEVKKYPEEITAEQIEIREQELKKEHGPFRKFGELL